jgi:hypothetical protein
LSTTRVRRVKTPAGDGIRYPLPRSSGPSRFGRLVEAELKMLDTLYRTEALLEEISRLE